MKTKTWLLLFSLLCLLLAGMSVWLLLGGEQTGYAEVYSDGKLVVTLDLSKDTEYRFERGEAWNLLSVRDGKISVISASCPSQDCVHTGRITRAGQSIVCLPEQVIVTLEDKTPSADVVLG